MLFISLWASNVSFSLFLFFFLIFFSLHVREAKLMVILARFGISQKHFTSLRLCDFSNVI